MSRRIFITIATIVSMALPLRANPISTGPTMDYSWTKAPWTENDKPYATIRSEISKMAKQKRLTATVVQQYKAAYDKDSFDAHALFRWGFAAYTLDTIKPTGGYNRLPGIVDGFQTVQTFHKVPSYNFTRLKFLVWSINIGPDHQLLPLGKRLLQRDPKDYYVKYYLASLLYFDDKKEGPLQRKYIAEMMQQSPRGWMPRELLASIYERQWRYGGGRKEANDAIAMYQRLAAKQPVNAYFVKLADVRIKGIRQVQAKREAQAKAKVNSAQ